MRRAHLGDSYVTNNFGSSQIVEEENDNLTEMLRDKVTALKKVTIDIGQEVRDQNRLINDMDTEFDKSGGFLRSTMSRVTAMAKAGHNCYILYLLLFAMFVFFICWLIIKMR